MRDPAIKEIAQRMADALVWASESEDFAEGGRAREGWMRIAQPALDEYRKWQEKPPPSLEARLTDIEKELKYLRQAFRTAFEL